MAEKSYEKADARVFRWPGDDDKIIIFAEDPLNKKEIFRGPAKKWRGFTNDGFIEFLEKNNFSPETFIAIAEDGDLFAVIEIINF